MGKSNSKFNLSESLARQSRLWKSIQSYLCFCGIWISCQYPTAAQTFKENQFNPVQQAAYWSIWNLDFEKADSLLSNVEPDPGHFAIKSLGTCIKLFLQGDKIKYNQSKVLWERWIDALELYPHDAHYYHTIAILRLHRALLKISFGESLSGGLEIRQAYMHFKKNVERPQHLLTDEMYTGAFLVALSNIPENYNWAAQLVGVQGNEALGFAMLQRAVNSKDRILRYESNLFSLLLKNYLQFPREMILSDTDDLLATNSLKGQDIVCMWLYNKNNASEKALKLTSTWRTSQFRFPYMYYLVGITKYQLLHFQEARLNLHHYVNKTTSDHYLKDSYYKLSTLYRIEGDTMQANRFQEKVKKYGNDAYYVDKVAQKMAHKSTLLPLNLVLAKAAFDGGMFESSQQYLAHISSSLDLRIEQYYLLARNAEMLGKLDRAILYYKNVVSVCPREGNYKGPVSCLHLAELSHKLKDRKTALACLSKLDLYGQYEHKRTIQYKAEQLRRKIA